MSRQIKCTPIFQHTGGHERYVQEGSRRMGLMWTYYFWILNNLEPQCQFQKLHFGKLLLCWYAGSRSSLWGGLQPLCTEAYTFPKFGMDMCHGNLSLNSCIWRLKNQFLDIMKWNSGFVDEAMIWYLSESLISNPWDMTSLLCTQPMLISSVKAYDLVGGLNLNLWISCVVPLEMSIFLFAGDSRECTFLIKSSKRCRCCVFFVYMCTVHVYSYM